MAKIGTQEVENWEGRTLEAIDRIIDNLPPLNNSNGCEVQTCVLAPGHDGPHKTSAEAWPIPHETTFWAIEFENLPEETIIGCGGYFEAIDDYADAMLLGTYNAEEEI